MRVGGAAGDKAALSEVEKFHRTIKDRLSDRMY